MNAATLQLAMLDRRMRRMPPEVTSQLGEPLASAQAELNRLAAVVERFLAFSKPMNLVPEPVDLKEVVDSVSPSWPGKPLLTRCGWSASLDRRASCLEIGSCSSRR